MRQCSPPLIAGGSLPNRALTMRATCPAGTIGTVGVAADGGGGAGAAGGSATGCAGGGTSCSGLAGVCGASTPDELPGGIRFWFGPIEPGGRGTESNPGGAPCAKTGVPAVAPQTTISAAMRWRPHGAGMICLPVIATRLPPEIGRIQAVHRCLS